MINLYDILEAADGQLFGEVAAAIFTGFCFDSRRVNRGELFVAIKTERGDGHQHMAESVAGGALGIMCQQPPDFDTTGITVIVMRDVERALLNWTRIVLRKYGTTVIAVTGGAGKSTTKEAIAAVLSTRYEVYKSPGSFNGRLGVPIALGSLTAQHKLAVLEFGTDQFGEMNDLVEVVKPLVGIVTNINHSYTDRLGSLDNVTAEHSQLVSALPDGGLAVLNYDDERVRNMGTLTKANVLTVGVDTAGASFGADFLAYNVLVARDKTGFDLAHSGQRFIGRWIPLLGVHQVYNALAAIAVGSAFNVAIEESLRALTDLLPLPGRMRPLDGAGKSLMIDDSFSATPESTLAALDWMRHARLPQGRTIFVFGDIDDLGSESMSVHREVGRRAAEVADVFITEGEMAAVAGRAALDAGMRREQVHFTFSPQDAAHLIRDSLSLNDLLLVKGGAASRMENVTRLLLDQQGDAALLPRAEAAYTNVWMNRPSRPTWIEIDQAAVAHNTRRFKQIMGDDVTLMAVVKANAYGHGALAVSTTALHNGATYLGVATVNEAIELRDAGITAPILCMGYTPPWAVRQALRYDVTLTLYDLDIARSFDRVAREMNARLRTHIKIDTGMSRLGLLPDQVTTFFRSAKNLTNLEFEGIYTHFAAAESDADYTQMQFKAFTDQVRMLKAAGFGFRYIHAANTAGALHFPDTRQNMVRCGIGLYGLNPSSTMPLPSDFRPALTWKTSIAQVKTLAPGTAVGYGNTYRTRGKERIAIIPVGYADGFRRAPQHWGEVLVNGQRAPLVGRVSMDMSMINVTAIPEVNIGDEVVLIGNQGEDRITVDDVAHKLGTTAYEVVSTILARVPRV
jgi:alanine racemase